MERYHIFKLGLAILFYAAYCVRPMLVTGLRSNDLAFDNNRTKQLLKSEDYAVFYQGVDGVPGVDFPVLSYIPRTGFSCKNIESGYYADLDTDCQVFHICEEGKKISFLCPNGTVFEQSDLICEWWYKVNCTNSPNLYEESAEQLREDLAKQKASRRVFLDGQERNHGAVMRIEESSSISAKQNGRRFQVSPSVKNIVISSRLAGGKGTERSKQLSHSSRTSSTPPQRAIDQNDGEQKPRRFNDAETGNYVNNVNQVNGFDKNLKEYHVQFAGTSPALDAASSEKLPHVYTRSTTPSSLTNSISSNVVETANKKQTNGNRGSVKYNYSQDSLIPSDKYDLEFPKHKSQTTDENTSRGSSDKAVAGKGDLGKKAEVKQKSTAVFTKNDIVNRRLEPADSDELQVPQETAGFATSPYNSIAGTRKHPTVKLYPNHRTTYSDLKQPNFSSTKFSNSINSVTPQYITTQSINSGKPFIGSTVGANIFNTNAGRSETSTNTPLVSSTQKSSFSATIQPAIFITSISPFESSTKISEIFASTFRPSISSTATPLFEDSTRRIVDHATVYGSFSKNTATTPIPASGAEVKFGKGVDKVGIHLTKSVGSAVSPLPAGQSTGDFANSGFVSVQVSGTSAGINTGRTTRPPLLSSIAGKTTSRLRPVEESDGVVVSPPFVQISGIQSTTETSVGLPNAEIDTVNAPKSSIDVSISQNGVEGSTSGPKTVVDKSKYGIAAPSPILATDGFVRVNVQGNFGKSDGVLVTSAGTGAVPVRGGKNVGSTPSPTITSDESTGTSLLLNTQADPEKVTLGAADTRPYIDGSTSKFPVGSTALPPLPTTDSFVNENDFESIPGSTGGLLVTIAGAGKLVNGAATIRGSEVAGNRFESLEGQGGTSSLPNAQIVPESVTLTPKFNKANLQFSTLIPPYSTSHDFSQTLPGDLLTTNVLSGSQYSTPSVESTTSQSPVRATYLPNANFSGEGNAKHGGLLPPLPTSDTSVNINDLDGTGAFIYIGPSTDTNINVSQNTVRSTSPPNTEVLTSKPVTTYASAVTSSPTNADIRVHVDDLRSTQGSLTSANLEGKGGVSSGSGFYVTKNSVYGPSTPSSLNLSTRSNYAESTPIVNVSPNSGGDVNPPQLTLSAPKLESSITLSKSESQWPRPFEKSSNSLDNEPVTPTYFNYKISSARPFELPEGLATQAPTLPTPFTTAQSQVPSMYENVDNMISVLKQIVYGKDQNYSSETPRPGLVVPPSVGPQTLHTLSVYFANALDGIAAERAIATGETLDAESKEKLTGLLTQMTINRYEDLFKGKGALIEEDTVTTVATEDVLEGEHSMNLIETPALRQLARNFSMALSSYLNDPEAFRKDLENLRPTEPPLLREDSTEATVGEEELLNFSDADSQSSFPPVFPTVPSASPTWGYIIASKSSSDLDLSNSLNPDLNTADTQSFVPRFNNLASNDVKKGSAKGDVESRKEIPEDHWTTSPGATKLLQSAFSINPAALNEHFETTEPIPRSAVSDLSTQDVLPSLPETEIQYDLRSLPQLSLNATQVHGILIDFMNTTKTDESNRLQRLLKKLNTSEGEFLDRMKEIESNPLTKRLILLLISECGTNVTEDLHVPSIHNLSEEILKSSESKSVVANGNESKSVVNSDIPALVDPSLQDDDQDTRALQLLNSLYSIASKFGK